MLWIYLTIGAYLIDAFVFAVDRILLLSPIPNPISYAFYASILSAFAIFLLPFGVHLPTLTNFVVAMISGGTFFLGLVCLYKSIKIIDILEAMPAIGAVTALTTFLLNVLLIRQPVTQNEVIAFFLLIIGAFMMSYFHIKNKVFIFIALSGIFLGLSYGSLKYIFLSDSFVNGVFWTRFGLVGSALFLLILPRMRKQIFTSLDKARPTSRFIFILNKLLVSVAFLMIYYAIKIGQVELINALQGLQYVFILIASILLAKKIPVLFEKHTHEHLWRKIVATVFIFAGLLLLFI